MQAIATAIGAEFSIPVNTTAGDQNKTTPELNDIFEYQQRRSLLQDAFKLDDLYRSGATTTSSRKCSLLAAPSAV
jgi:hypothetical protein